MLYLRQRQMRTNSDRDASIPQASQDVDRPRVFQINQSILNQFWSRKIFRKSELGFLQLLEIQRM